VGTAGYATAGAYNDAVAALTPDHWYHLDEDIDTVGDVFGGGPATDSGFAGTLIDGTYLGSFAENETIDPTAAHPGVPGPPLPGFDSSNTALDANNAGSVSLGSNVDWSNPVMTVATWFKVGNGFPGGSDGGDRIWTNNQNDATTSFQLTLGGGANIVVGIDPALGAGEGVTDPYSTGNFQVVDTGGYAGGTVAGTGVKNIKNSEWHHIVASRNGADINNVILVIDGVHYPPSTWSNSTDSWGTTGTNAQIATRTEGDGGGSMHVLNGPIDEAAIWLGRQLTVQESLDLYAAAVQSVDEGDSNGDGKIDGLDYLAWAGNYGKQDLGVFEANGRPGYLTVHGAVNGDYNYDNIVDGLDYLDWASNFGQGPNDSTSVPEPGSIALAVLACLGVCTVRRRR
jgi:hypothetical protein